MIKYSVHKSVYYSVQFIVQYIVGREDSISKNDKPANWTSLYREIYSTV